MSDPPPSGRGRTRVALLRHLTVTEPQLSGRRACLRRQYDLPGSPPVHARQAEVYTDLDAAQIADKTGGILQFTVTPSWEAHASPGPGGAPARQTFVATREDALAWMQEAMSHVQ